MNTSTSLSGVDASSVSTALIVPVQVKVWENLFRPHDFFEATVAPGQTIVEVTGQPDLPATITVDGEYIPKEEWATCRVYGQLEIRRLPEGDGFGRILATIAVIVIAWYAGPMVAGALGYTTASAASLATSLIGLAGTLLVNALLPPPLPDVGDNQGIQSLNSITGVQNRIVPFGTIPRLYGQRRFYPPIPMTALPYTEIVGDDQYIRIMLCLGYGPLDIDGNPVGYYLGSEHTLTEATSLAAGSIQIGDTDIDQFTGVEYEIGSPSQITLFTNTIVEQSVNIALNNAGGDPTTSGATIADGNSLVRTTDADTDEISLDIFFPALFTLSDKGKTRYATVNWLVEYSPTGAGTYTTAGTFSVSSTERKSIRKGFRYVLPSSGTWDIRVTRVSTYYQRKETVVVDATWTVLRSIKRNITPFTVDNTVVMALRIKATDQISGNIDRIAIKATSILPDAPGSSPAEVVTRSPGLIYADVAAGTATRNPKDFTNDLDWTSINAWISWCTANDITCDIIFDTQGTTFDRMRDVAAVGFASWHVTDEGLISVVRDLNTTPSMVISPRNVQGFTENYIYYDVPHALRVQFTDPDTWEQGERIVYDDGYTSANATKYEELPLIGVIDPDIAWKQGRYHLAAMRLRPETFTWQQDIQQMVFTRGDSVNIHHDIISVGLAAGRIKTIAGDGLSCTVDEVLYMSTGTTYAMMIQKQDGSIITQEITTVDPYTSSPTFTSAVSGVSPDDHFVFGVSGSETIKGVISRIEPRGSLTAVITAIPAADNIFDAWTGGIPTYNPYITTSVNRDLQNPVQPTLNAVYSDFNMSLPDNVGILRPRMVVEFEMPPGLTGTIVEVMIRTRETLPVVGEVAGEWQIVGYAASDAGTIIVTEVETGITYDVSIRSARDNGRVSLWTTPIQHTVVGASQRLWNIPPNIRMGEGSTNIQLNVNTDIAGSPEDGTIQVVAGVFMLSDGTTRTIASDTEVFTPWSVDVTPRYNVGFLMWGVTNPDTRFGAGNWGGSGAEAAGMFAAHYDWGADQWYAIDLAGTEYTFTPASTDFVFALLYKDSATGGIDDLILPLALVYDPEATYGATLGVNLYAEDAVTILGDIDLRNDQLVAVALGGALNANPTMRIPQTLPGGALGPASWLTNQVTPNYPQYADDAVRDIAVMPTSGSVMMAAAIRANPDTKYEFVFYARSTMGVAIDIAVRSEWLSTELETGKQYIGSSANSYGVQARTNLDQLDTNVTLQTTFTLVAIEYDPDDACVWFSPSLYNKGLGNSYEVEWFIVREKSTWGATAGTNLKDSAGNILDDIDVRNDQLVTQSLSAINQNPSFQIPRVTPLGTGIQPASWFNNGSAGTLTYEDVSTRDVAKFTSGKPGLQIFNGAIRVSPNQQYEIAVLAKYSGTPSGTPRLTVRFHSTTDELDTGERAVLNGSVTGGGSDPSAIFHTANASTVVVSDQNLTTSYAVYSGTFVVPAGTKWGSIQLDPNDNGGVSVEVEWCVLRVYGATAGGDIFDASGDVVDGSNLLNYDDAIALKFNPQFADWPSGSTYPTGWTSWSGTPTKVTSADTVPPLTGPYAVQFSPTGSNMGIQRRSGTTTPIVDMEFDLDSVIIGSVDMYIVSHTSGGPPGIMIDFPVDGSNYIRKGFPIPDQTRTGVWQRVPFKISRRDYHQSPSNPNTWTTPFTSIRIYLMASYNNGAVGLGLWTGTIIYDNLRFQVVPPGIENEAMWVSQDSYVAGFLSDTSGTTGHMQPRRGVPIRYKYSGYAAEYQNGSVTADTDQTYPWLTTEVPFFRGNQKVATITLLHLGEYGIPAASPSRSGTVNKVMTVFYDFVEENNSGLSDSDFTVTIDGTTRTLWDGTMGGTSNLYMVLTTSNYDGMLIDYDCVITHNDSGQSVTVKVWVQLSGSISVTK